MRIEAFEPRTEPAPDFEHSVNLRQKTRAAGLHPDYWYAVAEERVITSYSIHYTKLYEITPLLALVGLLLGVFAVLVTPREEEPQINVTFANVFIPFPGATAVEIENLVAMPAEQVLSEIEGIKHVYSTSRPGMAVLTVQFEVGEDREDAIVRP